VPSTPVTQVLDAAGVEFTLHVHDHPVRSLEQAAAERGLRPEQIVRTLVFRLEGETFLLVLAPGPQKVSWRSLRRLLGVTRITTASRQEVLRVTGYPPGAVSPLGLATPLRILADRRLRLLPRISIGAGIPNAGVELRTEDLLQLTRAELVDLD
jgi:Cys-tRNA(Pro) deacylase